ncbi:MAG TPA: 30S ribosomal protein S17 [Syntrophorhabdus sp.]|jgi:small subunit ribosomal protein S17|nr:30S ribosomal protein S17 [Syntrophorhabdus sp.]MDI9557014.1 30S ribosomal protein S17 [Pseudomonadota bacterium]OPX95546.1 MAG: 30S ribosomal protein S17 [Syntrophorhabdus sp. PtaB.Bin027]OQB75385.1 MAG: 30S ribosomal protein S17 [Deltaproteobacteria bacterium ADurb.Bin135]MBP8745272.1 30S ribosomal protein S17 [Syntrophorhabdus sp.]
MEAKVETNRRKMTGVVVKDKMDKTVVIEVEKFLKHPKYHKYLKRKKRYKAHDDKSQCNVGDRVIIVESRPLSKEKRWVVKGIIEKEKLMSIREEVTGNDTGQN